MTTSDSFTLGLVQMKCDADPLINMEASLAKIAEAAKLGAQVVCLPELFLSHYFCKTHDMKLFDLAEEIPGPRTELLAAAAKRHKVVVVASLFEKRITGTCMNTAVVFDADGSIAGLYRKMHIPHDPLFYEKYYFRQGDLGFKAIATKYAKLGILVCWDQWFPEAARITALHGAEVLIYPTAIGWHPAEKTEHGVSQQDAWRTVQRGHAIANGIYVAAINRVGYEEDREGGLEFWGTSFIADPFGIVEKQGSEAQEEIIISECRRSRMTEVRRNWPFFRDRRTDAYGDILKTAIEG